MALPASEFVREMMGLSLEERAMFLDSLPQSTARRVRYSWNLWARPGQQWDPGPETFTIYLAGRGYGKTRTGAEAVKYVAARPELCGGVIGIAGRTANEVNRTMVNGDSGIMSCYAANDRNRPRYVKSDKRLVWPNGVEARLFSGEEPESFRGPNIGFLWADELAHWTYLKDAWEVAKYVLRIGEQSRCVITTTPIGVETLERLVWEFDKEGNPIVADASTPLDRVLQGYVINSASRIVSGDTYENAANLTSNFFRDIVSKNEGTALADQEIRGVILRGVPTAMFKHAWIRRMEELPDDVEQVVVAVDPSGARDPKRAKTAEVGIVVLALSVTGMVYVIEDVSARADPHVWGNLVWQAVERWGADAIAAEDNYGGEMVRIALEAARPKSRSKLATLIQLVHATRDKGARASLVAPLSEVGRIVHCGSPRKFVHLERQMTSWDPHKPADSQPSPDRMDAMVWGVLYLLNGGSDKQQIRALGNAETWNAVAEMLRQKYGIAS
jgi:phage terminase large subunit-like protein